MTPLTRKIANLLDPLAELIAEGGGIVPQVQQVEAGDMPQPYRHLLDHQRDMTSTLESHLGSTLHIRPRRVRVDGELLYRQVVLVSDDTDQVIEFGAIRIHLDQFDESGRSLVLEHRLPLGAILSEREMEYRSQPTAFFQVMGAECIRDAFGVEVHQSLYGRHNILTSTDGHVIAEVVEILPPLEDN